MKLSLYPASQEDREFLWWLPKRSRSDEEYAPAALMMIEAEGQRVGYIRVQRSPEELFLASIEVAPAFQNRGIATQLITDLLRESDERGVPIKLFALKVNPARRLYERLGFHEVDETATHYVMKREAGDAA